MIRNDNLIKLSTYTDIQHENSYQNISEIIGEIKNNRNSL